MGYSLSKILRRRGQEALNRSRRFRGKKETARKPSFFLTGNFQFVLRFMVGRSSSFSVGSSEASSVSPLVRRFNDCRFDFSPSAGRFLFSKAISLPLM